MIITKAMVVNWIKEIRDENEYPDEFSPSRIEERLNGITEFVTKSSTSGIVDGREVREERW
jgi:hypothetical protein